MTLEWELKQARLAFIHFEAVASSVVGGAYIVAGWRRSGGGHAKGFFISHESQEGDRRLQVLIVQELIRDEDEAKAIAEAYNRRAMTIAMFFRGDDHGGQNRHA
jgi:hypothetical protein